MVSWYPYVIAIVSIYFTIGFIFNLFLYLNAKLKSFDEKFEGWDEIMNTLPGFIYFFFFTSLLWLPIILYPFKMNARTEESDLDDDPERTWWWHIRHPYVSIKRKKRCTNRDKKKRSA
ncbi:hypothetical protein ACFPOG_12555 [Paenibacillus aestuarii]|uniref:Uncharacterized protein n=1 Tax=Paenibacillus aestuarii TaxID=516965 RepID=A0ABW0K6Q5_9BACL